MIRFSRLSVRRSLVAALLLTAAVAAAPSHAVRADALPHLKFLRSSPTADTTLASSPDAIRIWLSEPTELPATKIVLTAAKGDTISTAAITRAEEKDAPLVAKLNKPLASGGYAVTWKAMSKDGHVVNGTFKFTIGGSK